VDASSKPIVFVSHIAEEAELAIAIQSSIKRDFLNLINVFVSSDRSSMGNKWLNDLSGALERTELMLVLCSPFSVGRPWINFEAGAGWVREIPIIPVCHTGLKPSSLPVPLNLLNGIEANMAKDWPPVYKRLAERLGQDTASPDGRHDELADMVRGFEKNYGLISYVRRSLSGLFGVMPALKDYFEPTATYEAAIGTILQEELDGARRHLDDLVDRGVIEYSVKAKEYTIFAGGPDGGYAGFEYDFSMKLKPIYLEIASIVMDGM
jgi:hypothetical protein